MASKTFLKNPCYRPHSGLANFLKKSSFKGWVMGLDIFLKNHIYRPDWSLWFFFKSTHFGPWKLKKKHDFGPAIFFLNLFFFVGHGNSTKNFTLLPWKCS